MKLIWKKEKTDLDRLMDIEVLDLKAKPYEIKEDIGMVAGILLPLTTFCACSAMGEPVAAAALTAFSILPSALLMMYFSNKADVKHRGKLRQANEYYENKKIANLSGLEKTLIVLYAAKWGYDKSDSINKRLADQAKRLRELKYMRDARDISYDTYKNELEKIK